MDLALNKNHWGFPISALNSNEPSPYLYQKCIRYHMQYGIDFHHSLVEIAKAHKKNPQGLKYIYYGNPIGKGIVRLFFPGDSEHCSSKGYLQIDEKGNSDAKALIENFENSIISKKGSLLKYKSELSHIIPEQRPIPFPLMIALKLTIHSDVSDLVQYSLIRNRMDQLHISFNFISYQEIGTSIYHIFIPFLHYEDIELKYQAFEEVFSFSSLNNDASRSQFYLGLQDYQTDLLSYVSSCDNSGC